MKDIENIVAYSEKLAHLKIPEDKKTEFAEQIGKILTFVEKLNELDTSGIEPTAHILPVENVTRKDIVKPSIDQQIWLSQAPMHSDGCIKVPTIIKSQD